MTSTTASLSLSSKKVSEISDYIKWITTQKKTDELVNILLFKSHKSVAVRRLLAQSVAILGDESIIETLEEWKQNESDRKTWILIETAIDRIQRKKDGVEIQTHSLTITEALTMIRAIVSEKTYTIEGEISETNVYGQMHYFTIKDLEEATLGCSCFANTIYRAGFPLNLGLSVRVMGKFKINQKSSRLYFDVQHIELTGEGELLRNLKLLEEKLKNEGVIDPTRKRIPTSLPKNILLFASPNSAALTDFITVIGQRRRGLHIYHFPIKTQGVGVESELLDAFSLANQYIKSNQIDTIVITRGGGSKEDLMAFNSEAVVRAIHGLSRPTIVAIGHERDITIAELVADVRASTPSQAAELSSKSSREVSFEIETHMQMLMRHFQERQNSYQRFVDQILYVISGRIVQLIQEYKISSTKIDNIVAHHIHQIKSSNLLLIQHVSALLFQQVQEYRHTNNRVIEKINRSMFDSILETRHDLSLTAAHITMEHPKTILQKGYALVSRNGKDITSTNSLNAGDLIDVLLADGQVSAKVQ